MKKTINSIADHISKKGLLTTENGEPSMFSGLPADIKIDALEIYVSNEDAAWLIEDAIGKPATVDTLKSLCDRDYEIIMNYFINTVGVNIDNAIERRVNKRRDPILSVLVGIAIMVFLFTMPVLVEPIFDKLLS